MPAPTCLVNCSGKVQDECGRMGVLSVKRVVLVLLGVWLATLCYIWLPDIFPEFLRFQNKYSSKGGGEDIALQMSIAKANASYSELSLSPLPLELKQETLVDVVIASDINTLGGMIALINSIISNTKTTVIFHLITNEETAEYLEEWILKSKLRNIRFEIIKFPVTWLEGKIKVRGGRQELANPLNYARYYLPQLLPHIDGRIIYIDADCIVQGDIQELNNKSFKSNHFIAFAEDCVGMSKRITFMQNVYADYFDLKNKHFKDLKINPKACSFNTGVFVTELSQWQKYNITKQLEYWLELNTKEELYGNERGGGGSQPPMMLVFYNWYTPIDQIWHVNFLGRSASSSLSRQYVKSAKLLHWNGHFKPWQRAAPFQDLWDIYYLQDPANKFHVIRKGIL